MSDLPEGFVLDPIKPAAPAATASPALPSGAELPEGFVLDEPAANAPSAQPEAPAPQDDDRTHLGRSFLAGVQRGAIDLAGLPVDTVANVGDLVRAAIGTGATAAGHPDLAPDIPDRSDIVGTSDWIASKLAKTGAQVAPSNPESGVDRAAFTFGRGASAAAAGPPSAAVSNALRGGVGAIAGQEIGEATGSPALAVAANLAAGRAPEIGASAVRGVARGGPAGAAAAQERIADFDRMGVDATLAQANGQHGAVAGVESLLAKAPGSAGVMQQRAGQTQQQLGDAVGRTVDKLAPTSGVANAGRAIDRGIRGEGGFVDETKKMSNSLYADVDKHIAPTTRVAVENTKAVLPELNEIIAGAPEISKYFQNSRIAGMEAGLRSDTGSADAVMTRPGMRQVADQYRQQLEDQAQAISDHRARFRKQLEDHADQIQQLNNERTALGMKNLEKVPTQKDIDRMVDTQVKVPTKGDIDNAVNDHLLGYADNRIPYEALKKLRTLVGNEMDNTSLVSDVPRSKWKAVYGALSRDMEGAAREAGPEAEQSLQRANNYYGARARRLDILDSVVQKSGGPEAIFNAAMSGTKEGATHVQTVMKSIPKEGRQILAATVLERMGKATPGRQDATGNQFSSETFLTNFSRLSPEAQRVIFESQGPAYVADLRALSNVAANLRAGSKVFSNPSGTASTEAAMGAYGGLGGAVATGHLGIAGGIAGTLALSNLSARVLTNPRFTRWAARLTRMPPETARAEVFRIAADSGDGDEDIRRAAEQLVRKELGDAPQEE